MKTKEDFLECECEELHGNIIEERKKSMPSDEEIYELSDFFKVLGDSTRMKILSAIDGAEMCVCDISNLLGMTKSAVSHQLKVLRHNDLVRYRKSGKNVFYFPADEHVHSIINKALEHINEK